MGVDTELESAQEGGLRYHRPRLSRPGNLQEAWFQPMGLRLRLRTNSTAIRETAAGTFARFGPVADRTGAADDTLTLLEHGGQEVLPARPNFSSRNGIAVQTTEAGSILQADRSKAQAHGWFSHTVVADRPYFRWHFLELAFFYLLAPRGIMGVHGAALAHEGRALLLRAASGGGKSTLAYAGARSHFQVLAEDVVWIDLARRRWWGMPWRFHLLPDARDLFPELASYRPILQTNQELKLEVELESIRRGSTTSSASPGPVVLLSRRPGGRSYLEPVSLSTAWPLWMAGCAGDESEFPGYEDHVAALLRDRAYHLHFGDDIEAALALLQPLFA